KTRAGGEPALSSSARLRVTVRSTDTFTANRSRHRSTLATDAHARTCRYTRPLAQINASAVLGCGVSSNRQNRSPMRHRARFLDVAHWAVRRRRSIEACLDVDGSV